MSGWWMEKGILILEIIKGSKEEMSGKIEKYERIMYVNGEDVESCRLEKDQRIIKRKEKVNLVVDRKRMNRK